MSEIPPLQSPLGPQPDAALALPNPNPNPSTSDSSATQQWEASARAWLSALPVRRDPTACEMDAWIDSNPASLPQELRSLPRPQLHQRILFFHNPIPSSNHSQPNPRELVASGINGSIVLSLQAVGASQVEHPYRFQRTDLWMPVYSWLESLDTNEIIQPEDITVWLSANPEVKDRLFSKHPRYHLMHYIQKLHMKVLKKRGKLPKGMHLSTVKASVKTLNGDMTKQEVPFPYKKSGNELEDNKTLLYKKKEAFLRYELLTDLQNQLASFLVKHKHAVTIKDPRTPSMRKQTSENETNYQSSDVDKKDESMRVIAGSTSHSQDMVSIHVSKQTQPIPPLDTRNGQKRKRNPVTATPAWSYCEALPGTSQTDQSSSSHCEEARTDNIRNGDPHLSTLQRSLFRKNILMCLQGREKGVSWPLACSRGGYAGRNQERWIPFLEGWRSLGRQFEGTAVWFSRRSYSSWLPTWCAYTSSVAVAQPHGRQGVQKVLDVRFHPEGMPQLVCSSNEAPNELLLYNLLSGRATQLSGHNCQIQAVEFAVRGASVVSCGSNLLKVWDCTTGSCLYTLGSIGEDQASIGHTEKINAMTVNAWQSCLVATGGSRGDGKLLLWNALRGELAADLNSNLRVVDHVYPSIDAIEFCSENLLVCGSDCEYGSPAVVQLWDIESPLSCRTFPANDSYITSLKVNPACNTIITGAGDGTVGLFDVRTCGAINYLSVGSGYEVTSVSFSSCGTYFNASSTSNNTLVWDTRLMPMNRGQMPMEKSHWSSDMHFIKPLHCLSHGKQMPTAEHAGQLPGHVDEGDQGVNDARWLQREPVLVTVSGDGSIAMWDVTLGQPCVKHLFSHTRCVNTVAVAPNDDYLCSGGDDQKVVLYHNRRGGGSSSRSHLKWRLSHPLTVRD